MKFSQAFVISSLPMAAGFCPKGSKTFQYASSSRQMATTDYFFASTVAVEETTSGTSAATTMDKPVLAVPEPAVPELKMPEQTISEPKKAKSKTVTTVTSQALPWMQAPAILDGSLVGDAGFDPFGFAKSQDELMNYREAEIKHARLAMLAAAGWPISELLDKKIALALGLNPILDASDRAPSVLNGGLGKISPAYWIICLAAAAAIDGYALSKLKNDPEYFPGNLGFDPLGLYPKDEEGQRQMQLKELKNGRLAMMAVFGFAIQEAVYKIGVVDETPGFFKPLGDVMHESANAGYYIPN